MEEKNYSGIVPSNHDGGIINAETSVDLHRLDAAVAFFSGVKQRLLAVNFWHKLAGEGMAHFQMTDESGSAAKGNAQKGYYIKIDIPGPGPKNGDGFDWVRIEEMEEFEKGDIESVAMRVRPAANPLSDDQHVAHFYSVESTSTFTVTREGAKITAAVYDRNTKVNTDSDTLSDRVRNSIAGVVGRAVLSKIQWKKLTEGLLSPEY